MPQLSDCPHCGKQIEDDSAFCDQCGAGLFRCPQCGKFLKGKFCPSCGVQSVKAGTSPSRPSQAVPAVEATPAVQAPPPQQIPQQAPAQPVARPTTDPGRTPSTGTAIPGNACPAPARLSCRSLGIILPLATGAIIGRVNGNYVAQLSTLNFISGTHGRVEFNGVTWTFTDLGSTNGTTVNGIPCPPHSPVPFKAGDMIRIGKTYDFYVE